MTTLIPVLVYLLLSLVLTRFIAARQDKASLYQDKAARFFIGGRFLNGPMLP